MIVVLLWSTLRISILLYTSLEEIFDLLITFFWSFRSSQNWFEEDFLSFLGNDHCCFIIDTFSGYYIGNVVYPKVIGW